MDKQETYERIEQYLAGNLTDSEKLAFEAEIAGNAELRELVALHQHLDHGLKDEGADKLSAMLKQVDSEQQKSKTKGKKPLKISYTAIFSFAAAMIAIVCIPFYFIFFVEDIEMDNLKMYAAKYETYPSHFTLRGGSSRDTLLSLAYAYYDNEEYSQAIPVFDNILADSASDLRSTFYLGLSYLGLEQFDQTLPLLQEVSSSTSPYKDAALWYSGLVYLKQNNRPKAVEVFKKLSKGKGKYAREGAEVLESFD